MKIIIAKGVDQKKIDLIHSAIDFYSKLLIHGNTRNVMTIKVAELSRRDKKANVVGQTEWEEENIRPRNFVIYLHSRRSKKYVANTLAHEMLHVKQYVKDELKDRFRPEYKIYWKNEEINMDEVPYEKHPWEIEAFAYEGLLLEEFQKYHDYF